MTRKIICFFLFFSFLSMPGVTLASGSYATKLPKAGANKKRSQYILGKSVFTGKARLEIGVSDAVVQLGFLSRLENELPGKVKMKANLSELAGKLSERQLDALVYYLIVRYKVKLT